MDNKPSSSPKSFKLKEYFLQTSAVILGGCFTYYSFIFLCTCFAHLVDMLGIRLVICSVQVLPFWTPCMMPFLRTEMATKALSVGLALLGVITNIKILLLPAQIKSFTYVYACLYVISIDDKFHTPMMTVMLVSNTILLALLTLTSLVMCFAQRSFLEKLILAKTIEKRKQAVVSAPEVV